MTQEQQEKFKELTRPLMDWLQVTQHPHMKVIVTPTDAELVEGVSMCRNEVY